MLDQLTQPFNRLQMHMIDAMPVIEPDIAGVLLLRRKHMAWRQANVFGNGLLKQLQAIALAWQL
jgi:hypothetical protein